MKDVGTWSDPVRFSHFRLLCDDHSKVPAHLGPGPRPAGVLQTVPGGVPRGADDDHRSVPVHLLYSGWFPGGGLCTAQPWLSLGKTPSSAWNPFGLGVGVPDLWEGGPCEAPVIAVQKQRASTTERPVTYFRELPVIGVLVRDLLCNCAIPACVQLACWVISDVFPPNQC